MNIFALANWKTINVTETKHAHIKIFTDSYIKH